MNLEDFSSGTAIAAPPPETPSEGDYEAAYNAGWDDAMAQVDAEQGRIAERLADRLCGLERGQGEATGAALAALEPVLHEVFDKLLPRAAERGFLGVLLEEIAKLLESEAGAFSIQVAPEEAPALSRLLERSALDDGRLAVLPEPALSLSQALVRWDGGERRVDLEAVLAALDDALEDFLSTLAPEPQDD